MRKAKLEHKLVDLQDRYDSLSEFAAFQSDLIDTQHDLIEQLNEKINKLERRLDNALIISRNMSTNIDIDYPNSKK